MSVMYKSHTEPKMLRITEKIQTKINELPNLSVGESFDLQKKIYNVWKPMVSYSSKIYPQKLFYYFSI